MILTVDELRRRDEKIATLLDWYQDVVESWRDPDAAGDHGYPMMNTCWNHPSYQELERLRPLLRRDDPVTYWHVAERFFRSMRKRVVRCPRCERVYPYADDPGFHRHGQQFVPLVPASVPYVPSTVNPVRVSRGVRWLSERFRCEPFVPDMLLPEKQLAA